MVVVVDVVVVDVVVVVTVVFVIVVASLIVVVVIIVVVLDAVVEKKFQVGRQNSGICNSLEGKNTSLQNPASKKIIFPKKSIFPIMKKNVFFRKFWNLK